MASTYEDSWLVLSSASYLPANSILIISLVRGVATNFWGALGFREVYIDFGHIFIHF